MEPVSRIKNVQGIYAYSFSKDRRKKKRKIVVLEFILENVYMLWIFEKWNG